MISLKMCFINKIMGGTNLKNFDFSIILIIHRIWYFLKSKRLLITK